MKTKISANVDWMVVKKIDEYIHDIDMNRSEFIEQLFINFLIEFQYYIVRRKRKCI